MGRLAVISLGCRGVDPANFKGQADPYVEVFLGAVSYKVALIRSTLAPKFDDTYIFDNTFLTDVLRTRLYDSDPLKNELLGEAEFNLESVSRGHTFTTWLKLRGPVSGHVGLRVHPIDFGIDPIHAKIAGSLKGLSVEGILREMGAVFSRSFCCALHDVLARNDVDENSTLSLEEFTRIYQELYFATGTNIPMDLALQRHVRDLFRTHDKHHSAFLGVKELFAFLRDATLKDHVGAKWRASLDPADSEGLQRSVGRSWSGVQPPPPGTFAGYRLADGSIVERTRAAKVIPGVQALSSLPGPCANVEHKLLNGLTACDSDIRYCHVEGCRISRGRITGGVLESCILNDVEISNVKVLRSCHLKSCTLFNAHPTDCLFEGCVIKNGIMYASSVNDCELRDITALGCHVQRCKFFNFCDEGNNVVEGHA